jgi:hypothetical protein
MSQKTGGPAFPALDAREFLSGMTLRDYFAAKAMAALFDSDAGHNLMECQMIAEEAYSMAYAMLKEREK